MISINIEKKLHGNDGDLDLNFEATIAKGELVTLYGPSGSGKSSVLRMVAGLMTPDGGVITAKDRTWYNSKANLCLKPQQRSIGMVFQDYSLFPNMTVRENLEFALEKNQSKNIVEELLTIIALENLAEKRPSLLSGGQKQRVALARAMVRRPTLLLLDEPLSALDSEMRSRLQDYILQVHEQFGLTTILVSHDLPEVMKMSKRMLVLENGAIVKSGLPADLLPRQ